jgi:hypothetical protein
MRRIEVAMDQSARKGDEKNRSSGNEIPESGS